MTDRDSRFVGVGALADPPLLCATKRAPDLIDRLNSAAGFSVRLGPAIGRAIFTRSSLDYGQVRILAMLASRAFERLEKHAEQLQASARAGIYEEVAS